MPNLIPNVLSNTAIHPSYEYVQYYDDVTVKPIKITIDDIQLIHLSKNKLLELKPFTPNNRLTQSGDEYNKISRISFGPDIEHCFLGLGNASIGKEYFVHEPDNYGKLQFVPNEFLIKHKLVPDAHITKECWVLNATRVRCTGKVKSLRYNGICYNFEYHDPDTNQSIKDMVCHQSWYWVEAYYISFPTTEHDSLIARLSKNESIYTTRINEEYAKYKRGDVLDSDISPKHKLVVRKIRRFRKIDYHPFYDQLTKQQRDDISKAGRYEVIELSKY